jgi:bifunctional non-homologous end joining protein LigD
VSPKSADSVRVSGVTISHPDKVWWPDDGITKLDVVRFYDGIAELLRPWLRDRPLTAERCPDGMLGDCFFQKNFARGLPPGTPTFPIRAAHGKEVHYAVGGSRGTLLALVNLGSIAIHVMNARTAFRDRPDWLAFDLDPTSGFADAARAAAVLRGVLEELRLRSYPKTSGGRGLHVFVPLRLGPSQEHVRAFAFAVGELLSQRAPDLVTTEFAKAGRGGRVFADAMRNASVQTVVPPYVVRRRPRAPVSTPLDWDEVVPNRDPADFNLRTFERRVAVRDPWSRFWSDRQVLPKLGEPIPSR